MIALGKFDALHRGHQALAIAASNLGGTPWLVSFAGMAEVLRWPSRLPLVAIADRKRVMQTWQNGCGGKLPTECAIPFAEVRSLSPEAFVELLANTLKVGGVAVGSNYRFGYKAAGDATLLQSLGEKYGIRVAIVDLVEHDGDLLGEVVSSSWVREALAEGDVAAAAYALDRPYRLVINNNNVINQVLGNTSSTESSSLGVDSASSANNEQQTGENSQKLAGKLTKGCLSFPSSAFMNQPPAPGHYEVLAHVVLTGRDMPHVDEGTTGQILITDHGLELADGLKDSLNVRAESQLALDFITQLR